MSYAQRVIEGLKQKYASEPVFLQAVEEVLMTLQPLLDKDAKYEKYKILERITEPERIISFRFCLEIERQTAICKLINTNHLCRFIIHYNCLMIVNWANIQIRKLS